MQQAASSKQQAATNLTEKPNGISLWLKKHDISYGNLVTAQKHNGISLWLKKHDISYGNLVTAQKHENLYDNNAAKKQETS